MLSNRLAFAALAVACVAAAAGGGYLASRQSTVPTPASAAPAESAPSAATPSAAAPADKPPEAVQETEALIGGTSGKSAAPAPVVAEAKSRSQKPAARPADDTPPNVRAPRATRQAARQETPALERTWPSSAAAEPPQATPPSPQTASAPAPDVTASRIEESPSAEPVRAPEPPQPTFEELVVSADSVIGLQTETSISSERARVEDRVEAHVTRDVRVGDRVAIPAGTKALGSVTIVDRGGKFKERARLGIRFNTLVLADGTELPISTETIYRDGDAPNSAQKVGGAAVGGAILGAIMGGGKGAVLGGLAGAGSGAAVTMAGDRNAATLPAGAPLTVRILSPVTVALENK
ncbi:MAG: hypothetical protein HY655_01010 [Acidobacteria bacterium]|nr:hypothetical protein [Acidobacteriota bacterium]